MIRQLLAQSPLLALPILGLLIFVGVFSLVVVRVLRRDGEEVDAMSRLPLEEDDGARPPVPSVGVAGVPNRATRNPLEEHQ